MGHDGAMTGRRISRLGLAALLAGLVLGPTAQRVAAADLLLPDLAMMAPFDFRIEISPSGRKLLRFSTVAVNIGKGPFQLYGHDADGAKIGDTLQITQLIKRIDGTYMPRDTTATMTWSGDGHNHWHINGYQRFVLNNLDGTHLRYVKKTGFCAFDSYRYGSALPAFYTWDAYACRTAPNGEVPMGTSRMWGDIYKSTIAFQWIDITGLASGTYRLNISVDSPRTTGGRFLESNESNNLAWAKISIGKTTVTVISKSAKP
jgi:hypothetical protein